VRTWTSKKALRVAAVGAVGVVVVFGAGAVASVPSPDGTIHGCYAKTGGSTRIIDPASQRCTASERPISWSQRGPRGPRGLRGPAGTNGTNGTAGSNGTDGVSGYEQVVKQFTNQQLPLDEEYAASCPGDKKVLGGGVIVQLLDDDGLVRFGDAPLWDVPNGASGWVAYVRQDAVAGFTNATVAMQIICATATP
jgi:hypothetical protein